MPDPRGESINSSKFYQDFLVSSRAHVDEYVKGGERPYLTYSLICMRLISGLYKLQKLLDCPCQTEMVDRIGPGGNGGVLE